MPALVPYKRALALGSYALPSKRARLAYGIASHLYTNRGRYASAARTIARAYRGYKKRRKRIGMNRIGIPKNVSNAKKDLVYSVQSNNMSTRTLYYGELTDIPRGSNNEINYRQRDQIYFSGAKVCVELQASSNGTAPIFFNMAVVYDKRTNDDVTVPTLEDFFRGNGSGSRAQDFDPTNLAGMQFHCLPLNTDRFTVLKHKRLLLNGNSGGNNQRGTNYKFMQFYCPVKKRIAYEDGQCQSKIHLLYWCAKFNTNSAAGIEPTVAFVNIRAHGYFRDR